MDSVIRKFPIGIQNFESLINDGYVYVDKTALVYGWRLPVVIISLVVPAVSGRVCCYLPLKLI